MTLWSAFPHSWRPAPAERGEEEPDSGGQPRLAALKEWGDQTSLTKIRQWIERFERGQILSRPPDKLEFRVFHTYLEHGATIGGFLRFFGRQPEADRAAQFLEWLENNCPIEQWLIELNRDFDERWRLGQFQCFAFDEKKMSRILISSSLRDVLYFDGDGHCCHTRTKEKFLDALFYRAAVDHQHKVKERPDDASRDIKYGAKKAAVFLIIKDHATTLRSLPDRGRRAGFVAPRAGCSSSFAYKILKDEGF